MRITPREWDLLEGIAAGLQNKEIAARLRTSPQTVKNQVSMIYRKVGLDSRVLLAGWYLERQGIRGMPKERQNEVYKRL